MFKKRYFFVFALRAVDMCPLQTEPSVKSTNPRRRLLDEKNEVFHFCDLSVTFRGRPTCFFRGVPATTGTTTATG